MWFLRSVGIQMTRGPARSNLLRVAFPCLTFRWLMRGQCLCVNLPTPLTQLPSAVASHTSWDYEPDAEAGGAGTFCGQRVINVFDGTLRRDHLKSWTALWGIHAHGVLCGTMLFHLPSIVTLVAACTHCAPHSCKLFPFPFSFLCVRHLLLILCMNASPAELRLSQNAKKI